MAPKAEKIRVLRVLCREDFSMQSAESFVDDLKQAMTWLDGHFIYTPQQLKALQMSMKWQGVARRAIKVRAGCNPAKVLDRAGSAAAGGAVHEVAGRGALLHQGTTFVRAGSWTWVIYCYQLKAVESVSDVSRECDIEVWLLSPLDTLASPAWQRAYAS